MDCGVLVYKEQTFKKSNRLGGVCLWEPELGKTKLCAAPR